MRVYEITAETDEDIADEYCRYLVEKHMPDMIATGCFESATIFRDDSRFRVCYFSESEAALEKYLTSFAEKLRSDALQHFPAGVAVQRANWEFVAKVD